MLHLGEDERTKIWTYRGWLDNEYIAKNATLIASKANS